jgi:pimeloyl-ACP methyl ester carboxylesterase
MLPLLERSFEVLALDMPGFGRSPALPAEIEPTPEALGDAVEAAMGAAGFTSAHLAGNSLGGWVALELARRGRARTVTAISPAGLANEREGAWGRGVLRTIRRAARTVPNPGPLLRNPISRTLFAGPTLGRPWRADPDDLVQQSALFASAPGFDLTLRHTMHRQVRGLNAIRCPVLVLWGTRDVVLLPRQGRRFERLIPGGELRYLKGLGHVPMSDDPQLLAGLIRQQCGRRAAARG